MKSYQKGKSGKNQAGPGYRTPDFIKQSKFDGKSSKFSKSQTKFNPSQFKKTQHKG